MFSGGIERDQWQELGYTQEENDRRYYFVHLLKSLNLNSDNLFLVKLDLMLFRVLFNITQN